MAACGLCGKNRGLIYARSVYSTYLNKQRFWMTFEGTTTRISMPLGTPIFAKRGTVLTRFVPKLFPRQSQGPSTNRYKGRELHGSALAEPGEILRYRLCLPAVDGKTSSAWLTYKASTKQPAHLPRMLSNSCTRLLRSNNDHRSQTEDVLSCTDRVIERPGSAAEHRQSDMPNAEVTQPSDPRTVYLGRFPMLKFASEMVVKGIKRFNTT